MQTQPSTGPVPDRALAASVADAAGQDDPWEARAAALALLLASIAEDRALAAPGGQAMASSAEEAVRRAEFVVVDALLDHPGVSEETRSLGRAYFDGLPGWRPGVAARAQPEVVANSHAAARLALLSILQRLGLGPGD